MLKNHNHDLVKQLSETSSSLWRLKEYKKNAEGCEYCVKLWAEAEKKLNEVSDILAEEVGRHVKEDRFK